MEGWLEWNFIQDVGPSDHSRLGLAHKVTKFLLIWSLQVANLNTFCFVNSRGEYFYFFWKLYPNGRLV